MTTLKNEASLLLRRLEARARKRLGQHFMVDEKALEFIAGCLHLNDVEEIIEIGPGLGFLTRCLLNQGGRVLAVEKDPVYAEYLTEYFGQKNFAVTTADILTTKISDLTDSRAVKVCGNIPYNITSPILEWLIGQKKQISEAVLTVQWEVAQRLAAKPGSKAWGALSVFVQYHANVETLKKVGPSSFFPAPKVDSAVIKITLFKESPHEVSHEALFFSLVRRAFQKRRKTLLNSLTVEGDAKFSREKLEAVFKRCALDSRRRAETLTLDEWAQLSKQF